MIDRPVWCPVLIQTAVHQQNWKTPMWTMCLPLSPSASSHPLFRGRIERERERESREAERQRKVANNYNCHSDSGIQQSFLLSFPHRQQEAGKTAAAEKGREGPGKAFSPYPGGTVEKEERRGDLISSQTQKNIVNRREGDNALLSNSIKNKPCLSNIARSTKCFWR